MKIEIDIACQTLTVFEGDVRQHTYLISSGANGVGEQNGSLRTPRGKHIVRAKIGAGAEVDSVFVARRPTGERYTQKLRRQHPGRDWILTRILWLSGTERGKNRLGPDDTMRRYIYIHGSPDDVEMGTPGSHGCIRMRNHDVIELFDLVGVGTEVEIFENRICP
jgi:lipoprotein-anchoring transpeptidase ErfK/SrfK